MYQRFFDRHRYYYFCLLLQVIVNSADDAILASHIIEQTQFGGITEKLRTHVVKLPGE